MPRLNRGQAQGTEDLPRTFMVHGAECRQWQSWFGQAQTELVQAPFYRNRVGFGAEQGEKIGELLVQIPRMHGIAGQGRIAERCHGRRRDIGSDRNHAIGTAQHGLRAATIVTAEYGEIRTLECNGGSDTLAIGARFLQAHDAFVSSQARGGFRQHVAAGARRHIVEHDRQPGFVGDRGKMPEQSFLGRPHIIRGHDQGSVGADGMGAARGHDGFARIRCAGSRQHRHAPGYALEREPERAFEFGLAQGMRFASGAGHHERPRSADKLIVDQRAKGGQIEPVAAERRGQRADTADEFFQARTLGCVGWRCYLPPGDAASILAGDAGIPFDMRKIPEVAAPIDSAPRPAANENYLLINAFAPAARPPFLAVAKRVADAGCNIAETRVTALGTEIGVLVLAQGPWDAIAKLETALSRLDRDEELRLTHFRTGPKPAQTNLLPYMVEVVAADKPGILLQLAEFFQEHGISVEQLQSMRYRAMQTGADMFSAQITIGIPANTHIAALRDDFLEFCDGQNLDAIMDPVKF